MCHVSLPHLFKSFFSPPLLPSQEWNMEMCLSKYVDDVSLCRITISSTSHDRTPCSDVLGFRLFFMYLSENRDSRLREWWITPNVRGLTWTTHWIFHIQVLLLSISLATIKKQYHNSPLMYPSWGWWSVRGIFYSSVFPYLKFINSLCSVEH